MFAIVKQHHDERAKVAALHTRKPSPNILHYQNILTKLSRKLDKHSTTKDGKTCFVSLRASPDTISRRASSPLPQRDPLAAPFCCRNHPTHPTSPAPSIFLVRAASDRACFPYLTLAGGLAGSHWKLRAVPRELSLFRALKYCDLFIYHKTNPFVSVIDLPPVRSLSWNNYSELHVATSLFTNWPSNYNSNCKVSLM